MCSTPDQSNAAATVGARFQHYVEISRQVPVDAAQQFEVAQPGGAVAVRSAPADTQAADALACLRIGAEVRSRLMRADGPVFLEIEEP